MSKLKPKEVEVEESLPDLICCTDEEFMRYSISSFKVHYEADLWCLDYAEDFIKSIKIAEGSRKAVRFYILNGENRNRIVEYIKHVALSCDLQRTTVHLAIYLYDIYSDYYNICNYQDLQLIALSSIHIATKVEESDKNIPEINRLLDFSSKCWNRKHIKEMEIYILKFFGWYIIFPTAATFIDYYANNVVQLEEYNDFDDMTIGEFITKSNEIVFDFLDLILQDIRLVNIKPSLMAAACLSATRKQLRIKNDWSEFLEALTGYTYSEIQEYSETLFILKKKLNEKFDDKEETDFVDTTSNSLDSAKYSFETDYNLFKDNVRIGRSLKRSLADTDCESNYERPHKMSRVVD